MTEPVGSPFTAALIAELGKKTGVCWLRYDGAEHAAWHVWLDGALCLVSGGQEQHLPGIADVTGVEVMMRSKENGGRLVTWVGDASVVRPADELWDPVTTALVAGRLNLDDLATAAAGWAEHSVVSRIVPTDRLVESPGALSDEAHRAVPQATEATTRGVLPKVLHRRAKDHPKLS
ncbi:MAG TPA: hypothetical protein VFG63_13395 [Nocardioidaceae bacterium]|nr:hypothetical protein [Nocardioidaceae bacterium]